MGRTLCLLQTLRQERKDAGECAGADADHHEQADAKAADRCGQNKGADSERSANLPNELSAVDRRALMWRSVRPEFDG